MKTTILTCATCQGSWAIRVPDCFVPRSDILCTTCTLDAHFAALASV